MNILPVLLVAISSVSPVSETDLDLSYPECRAMYLAAKASAKTADMMRVAHLCRRINDKQAEQ